VNSQTKRYTTEDCKLGAALLLGKVKHEQGIGKKNISAGLAQRVKTNETELNIKNIMEQDSRSPLNLPTAEA